MLYLILSSLQHQRRVLESFNKILKCCLHTFPCVRLCFHMAGNIMDSLACHDAIAATFMCQRKSLPGRGTALNRLSLTFSARKYGPQAPVESMFKE